MFLQSERTSKFFVAKSRLRKLFGFFVLLVTLVVYCVIEIITENDSEIFAVRKGQDSQFSAFSLFDSGKFYVNTESCRIPWVDPFELKMKGVFWPEKYQNCSKDDALISSFFNETQRHYNLKINSNAENMICCYQEILRSGFGVYADDKYRLLPCTVFHQDFVVPLHIDAMIVECKLITTGKSIQKDAFSFIQDRNQTLEFKKSTERIKKPNVLLIGIDSLSRMNFRRNMPKTANFLMENNWFELEGYNKVADNTFPNVMALMTGLNESTINSKCYPQKVGGLDNCNFIWKDFKSYGYGTAYAEDATALGTFNIFKKGFEKIPTDYYLRPLLLAIEEKFESVDKYRLKYCIGRRQNAEYIYDFGLEFANRYRKKPGFGLLWTNSFSHDAYDLASSMDDKMLEYFEKMKSDGIFETSIVIFLSDHGRRWGYLLDLKEGFIEERSPMFFISLPKWFIELHPEYVKSLRINANRLTSPFDIYQTLKHIINIGQTAKNIRPAKSCEKALSIFYEIPKKRSCADACIPEHWCACLFGKYLSVKNPLVKNVTDLIIDEINNYLKVNNFSLCMPLKRKSIEDAQVKTDALGVILNGEILRIKFKVLPKGVTFQATVLYDLKKQKVNVAIQDISRLDSYEPYSSCIDNKMAKKFCICI